MCLVCDPADGTSFWSYVATGTACDAGAICYRGSCAGYCDIDGGIFNSGQVNGVDSCQTCQPGTSTSAWSAVGDGTQCAGGICASGSCADDCDIDGGVYASGEPNPSDSCQVCTTSRSRVSWSDVSAGTLCDAGMICSSGSCLADCDIQGVLYVSGAPKSGSPCLSCQPTLSTSSWSNLADGTSCGAGQICAGGICTFECDIDGGLYPYATFNPSNGCQSCNSNASTSAWTNLPSGYVCDAGLICVSGSCLYDCAIDGGVYAAGAQNGSSCQVCNPSASTSSWTEPLDGTLCDAEMICTSGSCTASCDIDGGIYPQGMVNATQCQSCQPAASTVDWTDLPAGTLCSNNAAICVAGSCEFDCDIDGGIFVGGQTDPANGCLTCNSPNSFWAPYYGYAGSCGTGMICTQESACVDCGSPYQQACSYTDGGFYCPGDACLETEPGGSWASAICVPSGGPLWDGGSCLSGSWCMEPGSGAAPGQPCGPDSNCADPTQCCVGGVCVVDTGGANGPYCGTEGFTDCGVGAPFGCGSGLTAGTCFNGTNDFTCCVAAEPATAPCCSDKATGSACYTGDGGGLAYANCTACGAPGQTCCADNSCNDGCCVDGVCVAQGDNCDTYYTCQRNGACTGIYIPTGAVGEPCFMFDMVITATPTCTVPDAVCDINSDQCVQCGESGQACCTSPFSRQPQNGCAPGLMCQAGTCEPCGAEGQSSCPGGVCAPGLYPRGGKCLACGGSEQPCCPWGSCGAGLLCYDSYCHSPACSLGGSCVLGSCEDGACGGLGQSPCDGGACTAENTVDVDGLCAACGSSGLPCCAGNGCGPGETCSGGSCSAACGASGGPCCDGGTCLCGLSCSAGSCG